MSKKIDDKKNIAEFAQSIVPSLGTMTPDDVGYLSRLIAMGTGASRDNPKIIMREMSDSVLNALFSNIESVAVNPVSKPVAMLISLEWCYRNDHLVTDWIWDPEEDGGKVSYAAKSKLDGLLRPVVLE